MGRKTVRREAWEFLNKKSSTHHTSWYVPKIPSILQMLFRCGMLTVLNIGLWAIEIILIQGENVFWKFSFINQLYTDIASNPQDVSLLVVVTTWFLIWGMGGIIWVLGYWDKWVD